MRRSASPGSRDPLPVPAFTPSAFTHAKVLIASYGSKQAFEIAELNARGMPGDGYWDKVLQALRQESERKGNEV